MDKLIIMNVQMKQSLKRKAKKMADAADLTLSQWIRRKITEAKK